MIFTRSWLSEFIDISNIPDEKILSTLNSIGFEVESYKKISTPAGVVVGKVLECEKHPDADKLSVCQVDNGSNVVSIVCGAPNVAKDQMVAVATLGTKLPNGLVIKQTELRGVQSLGMLCSSSEIGLEKTNDGIIVFDDTIDGLKIGLELNHLPQITDSIFEIDITPNRGDCLSIYGIARELASVFSLELKGYNTFQPTEITKGIGRVMSIHTSSKTDSSLAFRIAQSSPNEKENRYFLMDYRIAIIGSKATERISKIIGYATHATGVILNIINENALLKNQDGKYDVFIEKSNNGINILKSKNELCQIGIKQSDSSKASLNDEVLVFIASYIDPKNLLNISEKIEKKDDSIWQKSSKGSEPNLQLGLNYLSHIASRFCGREFYAGSAEDIKISEREAIKVDVNKINAIIGDSLDKNFIVGVLRRLNFHTTVNADMDSCIIKIPPFRHDISNVHDIAEEILRIKGIDSIKPLPLLVTEEKRVNESSKKYYLYRNLRKNAVANGFFETVHFIFTDRKDIDTFGFDKIKESLDVSNPITAELNTLRTSLLLNILNSASKNFKNGAKCVALFESGVVFEKNRNEKNKMAFVWSGKSERESIQNSGKPSDISFTEFIGKISNIFSGLHVVQKEVKSDFSHPYRYAILEQNGVQIGLIGALHKKAQDYFDLPVTFVCEIELDSIKEVKKSAVEFSKLQKSERDLTLIVHDDLKFDYLKKCIEALNEPLIRDFFAIDVYKANSSDKESALSIRLILQSDDKTLSEEDISGVVRNVLDKFSQEFGIGIKQ
jgi:phenylalanyl-tRNA synthetase beta chain